MVHQYSIRLSLHRIERAHRVRVATRKMLDIRYLALAPDPDPPAEKFGIGGIWRNHSQLNDSLTQEYVSRHIPNCIIEGAYSARFADLNEAWFWR